MLTTGAVIQKPGAPSNIKQLIHDLLNKKYRLSFLPERVIYMNNGIEYYYVEAEDTDGSRFIINAYGLEAEDLFEEVHKCIICGRSIFRKNENANLIRYQVDENRNLFVEANCINLLKKLEIAYGKEFFIR
ncbi:MAG: hypothetical protein ACRD93_09700 [Nitrososphaeraceae archaeon]